MQIDQYLHKLGILDHFDTYVKLKERDFAKKIKEIIAVSDIEADEGEDILTIIALTLSYFSV